MKQQYVDAGGVRTFYLEAGQGPHLILLHGGSLAVDAQLTWHRNIKALAERFHVIAFDQLGFGRSDMPVDPAHFTKLRRAEHALSFLRALDIERATLVGHSEGGLIATWLAINCPERVAKLVLVASGSTSPFLGGGRDAAWMQAASEAYDWTSQAVSEDAFLETFQRTMIYHADRIDEATLRANYRMARKSGNARLFLDAPPAYADPAEYYAVAERHIHPHLASLQTETLLVWANDDPTVPVERGLALAEMIPKAEFHLFKNCKHMVMIDADDGMNRLLGAWS